MKSVLVIGLGRLGRHLAHKMQEMGNDVMVVDKSPDLVEALGDDFTDCIIGDCTNENVVQSLGVENFDICFVTIGDNFQSSLVITYLLKKLGARCVVAKARQDIQAELLKSIGAHEVIFPEKEMAEKLAVRYNADNIFDFIPLTGDLALYEIDLPCGWASRTILDVNVRANYNVSIIAVKRGSEMHMMPGANYIFCPGDHLMVAGSSTDVFRITAGR